MLCIIYKKLVKESFSSRLKLFNPSRFISRGIFFVTEGEINYNKLIVELMNNIKK